MVDIDIDSNGLKIDADEKVLLDKLLMLNKGDLKYNVLTGCGIVRIVNGRINKQLVEKDIRIQLEADGWKNETIEISGETIYVDAVR